MEPSVCAAPFAVGLGRKNLQIQKNQEPEHWKALGASTHSVFQSRTFLEETSCTCILVPEQTEKLFLSTASKWNILEFPCLGKPIDPEKIQLLQPKYEFSPNFRRNSLPVGSWDTSSSWGSSSSPRGVPGLEGPRHSPAAMTTHRITDRKYLWLLISHKICFKNSILSTSAAKLYAQV